MQTLRQHATRRQHGQREILVDYSNEGFFADVPYRPHIDPYCIIHARMGSHTYHSSGLRGIERLVQAHQDSLFAQSISIIFHGELDIEVSMSCGTGTMGDYERCDVDSILPSLLLRAGISNTSPLVIRENTRLWISDDKRVLVRTVDSGCVMLDIAGARRRVKPLITFLNNRIIYVHRQCLKRKLDA